MKRVLCLIESLGAGGAERQLSGLSVMLNHKGYDVEVWYYVKKEFYLPFLQENGVKSRYLSDVCQHRNRVLGLIKYIKHYNPDTVISYSSSASMITCVMKMFGANFNLIVSERNTTQRIGMRVRQRFFLYNWANHIVPNSLSQSSFISKNFPYLNDKVKVITNFVDLRLFSPIDVRIAQSGQTNIICVGRLMPQKNILNFITAVSRVVAKGYQIHIDWFGKDLKDTYSTACHNCIANYNLEDIFEFHDPSPSIQEEYRKADVFCLPSIYEGFPNVLCEAMSCGKPVLCSNVCDNPNIVSEGQNGLLFNPLNVDDIALTLVRYINLPYKTKVDMGVYSRDISLRLFSEDVFISKYNEII